MIPLGANSIQVFQSGLNVEYEIEHRLHAQYPNRNEKYYQIILKARQNLIQTNFKLNLTTKEIIHQCEAARPTWYIYFKSSKQYYWDLLSIVGPIMTQHAVEHLKNHANYRNWTQEMRRLKMLVFLSNAKILTAYFPALNKIWIKQYELIIEEYSGVLQPILKLSPGRTQLLIKNIANEIIIHKEKYFADLDLFDRFVNREYALFLTEQNN